MSSFALKRLWISLLLFAGCASAPQPPRPATESAPLKFEVGSGPYEFDWDVDTGRYRDSNLHVPAGSFVVTGFIHFITITRNAAWAPMVAIEVTGSDESYHLGLVAFVLSSNPWTIQFAVRDARRGTQDLTFATAPLNDTLTPFELRLSRSGELRISAGGDTARAVSVRPPFDVTRVRVTASTVHMQLSKVTITAIQE